MSHWACTHTLWGGSYPLIAGFVPTVLLTWGVWYVIWCTVLYCCDISLQCVGVYLHLVGRVGSCSWLVPCDLDMRCLVCDLVYWFSGVELPSFFFHTCPNKWRFLTQAQGMEVVWCQLPEAPTLGWLAWQVAWKLQVSQFVSPFAFISGLTCHHKVR